MNHAIMVWREHEKSLFLAKEQEKAEGKPNTGLSRFKKKYAKPIAA